MQLDPQETSPVWWGGAIKGGLKGMVTGTVVGGACALTITMALPTLAVPLLPFLVTGSVLAGLGSFIHGGNKAVAVYHQQKHNLRDEANINNLASRVQVLEQAIVPSRSVQNILARGPRDGFQENETARSESTPTGPTIH